MESFQILQKVKEEIQLLYNENLKKKEAFLMLNNKRILYEKTITKEHITTYSVLTNNIELLLQLKNTISRLESAK